MRAARFISQHGPPQGDHHALLGGASGVIFPPEAFQQFLEVGRLFAQGAHSDLLLLRVEPKTPEGGADALAALVRHRTIAKFLVLPIRGYFLLRHFGLLNQRH
ncbi:MAG: hypothetical protein ABSF71_37880 [Terriglobia bacterium]|jgi:hypothetical protein